MTASGSRIAKIAAWHVESDKVPIYGTFCLHCKDSWPCDASILAGLLTPERLATALDKAGIAWSDDVAVAAILAALEAQDAEVTR